MATRQRSNTPDEDSGIFNVDALLSSLEAAIKEGDLEKASNAALELARKQVPVNVQPTGESPPSPREPQFTVKVCIEDKVSSGNYIDLMVRPSMTVSDLKRLMLQKYGFPPEIQRWIINRRLPEDTEKLSKCNVKSSKNVLFLYLVTAHSVKLTKRSFLERYKNLFNDDLGPLSSEPTENLPDNTISSESGTAAAAERNNIEEEETISRIQEPVPPPPTELPRIEDERQDGWVCGTCTYLNIMTRPGCEMCGFERPFEVEVPNDVEIPADERRRLQQEAENDRLMNQIRELEVQERDMNLQKLLSTEEQTVIPNTENFTCPICFCDYEPGEGIVLRECLHSFCRDCLASHVEHCEEAQVKCPFFDDDYSCDAQIQEREIKGVTSPDIYGKYLSRSLATAESQTVNSFHCKSPDCKGWCIYEDEVNFFNCEVCSRQNCLTCNAQHEDETCREYQERLKEEARDDEDAKKTQKAIEDMLREGSAMSCPRCNVVVMKKEGCDWLRCSMCKIEICWITKGPRWGRMGEGDISGGCRCRVDGIPCHPDCMNCH